ncbi:asparagine synthase C-terminal domain-containing protein [Azoarcus sp. PA01]|nr:asparagine synthase C-terminal domain-containing protein [Azoarcus sp. PA01]
MRFAQGLKRIDCPGGMLAIAPGMSVAQSSDSVCAAWGAPRFRDPGLARIAVDDGPAVAWLRAFASSGARAPAGVAGRFAVVMIDPVRSRCLAAVDRFGSLPFCYARDGGIFAFSDRADRVPGPARAVGKQAIFDYLFFHHIPAPETVFTDVHRLPAAHSVTGERSAVNTEPYWQPVFDEPRSGDFPSLKREFLELVEQAVAREAADGNVGAFLSGGTDSSTVSGMLCRVLAKPPRTYSIGFDATGYDEMEYARIAARHFGLDHREYYVTPDDLLDAIPKVTAHFDQPFGNSSAVPAWICAQRARAEGIDKMLAGDGGDELFGGNSRYAKQRIFSWYDLVPGALSKHVIEPALALPGIDRLPLARKGASYVEQARVPLPDRTEMYNLLHRIGIESIFTPDFLAGIDIEHPAKIQRQTWSDVRAHKLINRMLAFDWKYTLADNDLPKVVGTTQLAGLDVGFPFLSDELVDFSLRLPPEWKLKGLTLRWFFKEALKGFLPDEIIAKKKHGFGLPFGVWATSHSGLQDLASGAVRNFAQRGIVRRDFARKLLDELLPAHPGYYGEMVWILMALEHWLSAHEDSLRETASRPQEPLPSGSPVS